MNNKSIFTRITRKFSKIAVDILHHFGAHDRIQSVEGVANQPKILTGCGESIYSHWSAAYETAQRVDAGRRCQLSPAEIQTGDGQNIFVRYDTFTQQKYFYSLKFLK